jgi:hypothetical protein
MNLAEIKEKLKKLADGKPKQRKWKPKDSHVVRLLPLNSDPKLCEDLVHTVFLHYNVNDGKAMYCPKNLDQDCPFCELADQLWSFKDEHGNQKTPEQKEIDKKLKKEVEQAVKHYAPIIVRKDGKDGGFEGPYFWEMTPKTYQALLAICVDPDWNEQHEEGGGLDILTSFESALDLTVSLLKKGEGSNKTNFDLTEVKEKKKFTKIGLSNDDLKSIMEKVPSVSDIIESVDEDGARKIFASWSSSLSSDEEGDQNEGKQYSSDKRREANAEKPLEGGSTVDETVDKLERMLNSKKNKS